MNDASALSSTLIAAYPLMAELALPLQHEVLAQAAMHEFRDGSRIFSEGQHCGGLPLVLQGGIKVFKRSESGREIVLYRVERGETCILTSSCLLGGTDYSAEGVAEGVLRLAILPPLLFQRMIAESPGFRHFLFSMLSGRLSDLMERVERLAFHRIDRRLAEFLTERTDAGFSMVAMTHQQIADEIGSVREMVTRTLGQLAEQGLVELSRAGVRIADPEGLHVLAHGTVAPADKPAGDKGH